MKILLGVHHFFPHYSGGAEGQAYRLAKGLIQRGHQVQVICVERIDAGSQAGITSLDDAYDGIPVQRLSYNAHLVPDRARWEYNHGWTGAHFQRVMKENRPDVFHLIGGYLLSGSVLQAAQTLHIPTVVSAMDFWFLCPRITMLRSNGDLSTLPIDPVSCVQCLAESQRRYRYLGKLAPHAMRKYWQTKTVQTEAIQTRTDYLRNVLNQTGRIISNSHFLLNMLVQWGVQPERIIHLRQGRDFPSLPPRPTRQANTPLRVGYLGQIAELKGVHVLVQACRQLNRQIPLQLKIYGDPAPFPKYSRRLQQMLAGEAHLELAGVLHGNSEVTQALNQMDVLVVPSLWYENSPNVILEAFAHHVPVVASNLGGMAELVQAGVNGLVFEPGNSADLAWQLKRLATEAGLLEALTAGIPAVPAVDAELDQTEEIYREVISL